MQLQSRGYGDREAGKEPQGSTLAPRPLRESKTAALPAPLASRRGSWPLEKEQHDGGCEVQIVSRDPGLAARLPCHSSISAVAWDWAGTCRKFEKEGIEPRLCRCSRETSLLSPGHLALDHKLAGLRQSVQDEPLNDRLSGTSKPGTGEALGKEGSTALSGAFSSAGPNTALTSSDPASEPEVDLDDVVRSLTELWLPSDYFQSKES
ncbi:hypothetical protein MJG53_019131 [Ovis ammon polii x Ovis aries]|uniref:Uncharacterized protein n=1 Tax=Ovis ammon polii x Ovis aries TaxID=2918886 RepID=A0ACB9U2L5_9CETA|nr:hypothetical protein MJG53_019131 [Ovis ammon polii x Ovis aries]